MKLIYSKETTLRMPNGSVAGPNTLFSWVSPRITQLSEDNSEAGGVSQRGESFRSVHARNPVMIVYVTPVGGLFATPASPFSLFRLQCRASVVTFDPYGAGNGSTRIADPVNIDASGLLATMGRMYFDLNIYATSQVSLDLRSRAPSPMQLKIRCEIYENILEINSTIIEKKIQNKNSNIEAQV